MADDGFTLLEIIISLMITSLIFLVLIFTLNSIQKSNELLFENERLNWQLCLNQLESLLSSVEIERITGTTIHTKEYTYDSPNRLKSFRYRKGRTGDFRREPGYVPLMKDVRSVRFQNQGDLLMITAYMQSGQILEGQIYLPEYFRSHDEEK